MSTIIKFDLKELRKLANDKNSCVVEKKVTQNIELQPWCLGNLKESIKGLLDYKIGKFDTKFNGILVSYKNLRILQNVGSIRNDNADINFQVQADYFLFRPYVGAKIKGIVNKKSTTHLGILVHRVFNVVIPRPTEEPGNKWIGTSIQEGQEVIFRIVVLDLYGALPYIRGELDESWLKQGADGDDEMVETKPSDLMNVSYVNFDKTKPHNQKQIGDGLPGASSRNSSKLIDSNKHQQKNNSLSIKHQMPLINQTSISKNMNHDSKISVTEKRRFKVQSKISDIDAFETTPKQSKKQKKSFSNS